MAPASNDRIIDLLITGGRISTFAEPGQGPAQVESIAIVGGAIHAAGSDAQLAGLAPLARRVIDLGGRRVLPGLIDSHIHAVRAGVSWSVSLHWERVRSVAEALATISARAAELPAGTWIPVIGGWHRRQFTEGRTPTPEELTAAAPQHPVYIQETYDFGFLNAAGLAACDWSGADAQDPPRGTIVRDEFGVPTGVLLGVGAFSVPTAKALAVSREVAAQGTLDMMREFASYGLTAVNDGGGLLVRPSDYDPLFDLWRRGELPLRFRLFISAWDRGGEVGNYASYMDLVQHDFGDDRLRVSGIGEVVHMGCHDLEGFEEFSIDEPAVAELIEISRTAAQRGWRMSMHAVLDDTLSRVLDAWEAVEAETGLVKGRRWSIVHADAASPRNLDRIAALGLGVLVQNRHLLKGGDYVEAWGSEATANAQPIGGLKARGVKIGLGTDATRANWFSPWAAINWFVSGRSIDGAGVRAAEHLMTREEAIRAYTADAAWFTGEDDRRGKLLPGYLADLFVPTLDPFECSDEELSGIRSDLTMTGGAVTWAAPAFEEESV